MMMMMMMMMMRRSRGLKHQLPLQFLIKLLSILAAPFTF